MYLVFSVVERLNKDRDIKAFRRRLRDARTHLEFVCELYLEQAKAGRLLLHEHPDSASSWSEGCVCKVLSTPGVDTVVTDQCQFGQRSREGNPIRKPTRWMSNCGEILEALAKRCTGQGGVCSATNTPHQVCSGRAARDAAIYPFAMCKAILEGLRNYLDS